MGEFKVEGFCDHLFQDVVINDGDIVTDGGRNGPRMQVQAIGHGETIHAV
jgi:hypothetical protein